MNKDEAIFLGTILGDGFIGAYNNNRQYKVAITGHSIDDKDFLINVIKPIFEKIFKKPVKASYRKNQNVMDLVVYSKDVVLYINKKWKVQLGKKKEVFIANEFLNNKNLLKNIIAGFFATDGSLVITNNNGIMYPRVEFQNISLRILKQIQSFLSTIGIKSGLYKMNRYGSSYGGIVYRLQCNGKENMLKFVKEIGFINSKHKLKYEEYKLEMLG